MEAQSTAGCPGPGAWLGRRGVASRAGQSEPLSPMGLPGWTWQGGQGVARALVPHPGCSRESSTRRPMGTGTLGRVPWPCSHPPGWPRATAASQDTVCSREQGVYLLRAPRSCGLQDKGPLCAQLPHARACSRPSNPVHTAPHTRHPLPTLLPDPLGLCPHPAPPPSPLPAPPTASPCHVSSLPYPDTPPPTRTQVLRAEDQISGIAAWAPQMWDLGLAHGSLCT